MIYVFLFSALKVNDGMGGTAANAPAGGLEEGSRVIVTAGRDDMGLQGTVVGVTAKSCWVEFDGEAEHRRKKKSNLTKVNN